MSDIRQTALADFKRIMKWIGVIAVLMVAGALAYLDVFSTLDTATVLATIFGVFCSVLLGCGLFAAAFFSDKSGLDRAVTDVTQSERKRARRTALSLPATIERNQR